MKYDLGEPCRLGAKSLGREIARADIDVDLRHRLWGEVMRVTLRVCYQGPLWQSLVQVQREA